VIPENSTVNVDPVNTSSLIPPCLLIKSVSYAVEVEPYACQVCASSFRSKNSLKLHYLLVHTTKRMACDVCGDRFSDPSLFKSHRLFHELESHVCDVCNRQFNHYWSYRKHKRSHEQVGNIFQVINTYIITLPMLVDSCVCCRNFN
jgi:hypothetical protein